MNDISDNLPIWKPDISSYHWYIMIDIPLLDMKIPHLLWTLILRTLESVIFSNEPSIVDSLL